MVWDSGVPQLAKFTDCFFERKLICEGVKPSLNLVGASLGRKVTLDLNVPSPVWNFDTRWVSCLSFNILPTRLSGPGDLTLGGGE